MRGYDDYEVLFNGLKKKYETEAGYPVDDASDIGIRLKVITGELCTLASYLDWVKEQMFPQTATEQQLDYHGEQRGLTRKQATKANGLIMFELDEIQTETVEVPVGTICSTQGENPIRYETLYTAQFAPGSKYTYARADAVEAGEHANLPAGNIVNTLVSVASANYKIYKNFEIQGGTNNESDEDFRKRILDSYNDLSNGTNFGFYRDIARQFPTVHSVGIVPNERGAGTINIYAAAKGGRLTEEVLTQVRDEILSRREINVDIQVLHVKLSDYTLYVQVVCEEGYSFDIIKGDIEFYLKEYFKNLEVGQSVYFSDIGEVIMHTPGVKRYEINRGYTSNYIAEKSHLAQLKTLNITEESV